MCSVLVRLILAVAWNRRDSDSTEREKEEEEKESKIQCSYGTCRS